LQALIENRKRSIPYAGAFLVKDEEGTDPSIVASPDSDNKSIDNLKGKELLKRLHEIGTLAQVSDDWRDWNFLVLTVLR
jgi:Lon-like ATP-dependent protease